MIKSNLEATRERRRKRDERNVAAADAMYEQLLTAEEDMENMNSNASKNIIFKATPWRDELRTILLR
eukprot:scaffold3416_cov65-Attheya_sp.AAC.1